MGEPKETKKSMNMCAMCNDMIRHASEPRRAMKLGKMINVPKCAEMEKMYHYVLQMSHESKIPERV